MAKYGIWMMETLVIKFCHKNGSSRGMRAYMEQLLPHLKEHRPDLNIEEVFRPGRHPMLVGLYRNGRSKPICVKNLAPEDIATHIDWLKNSHGRGQEYKVVRRRQLSRNPSIQGPWNVDTWSAQLLAENARRTAAAAAQAQY